ncbi:unnamed protein product, partial [Symbiodinium sp. CCMP2592]
MNTEPHGAAPLDSEAEKMRETDSSRHGFLKRTPQQDSTTQIDLSGDSKSATSDTILLVLSQASPDGANQGSASEDLGLPASRNGDEAISDPGCAAATSKPSPRRKVATGRMRGEAQSQDNVSESDVGAVKEEHCNQEAADADSSDKQPSQEDAAAPLPRPNAAENVLGRVSVADPGAKGECWQIAEKYLRSKGYKLRPAVEPSRRKLRWPRFYCLCGGRSKESTKGELACPVVWTGRVETATHFDLHELIIAQAGVHEPYASRDAGPKMKKMSLRMTRILSGPQPDRPSWWHFTNSPILSNDPTGRNRCIRFWLSAWELRIGEDKVDGGDILDAMLGAPPPTPQIPTVAPVVPTTPEQIVSPNKPGCAADITTALYDLTNIARMLTYVTTDCAQPGQVSTVCANDVLTIVRYMAKTAAIISDAVFTCGNIQAGCSQTIANAIAELAHLADNVALMEITCDTEKLACALQVFGFLSSGLHCAKNIDTAIIQCPLDTADDGGDDGDDGSDGDGGSDGGDSGDGGDGHEIINNDMKQERLHDHSGNFQYVGRSDFVSGPLVVGISKQPEGSPLVSQVTHGSAPAGSPMGAAEACAAKQSMVGRRPLAYVGDWTMSLQEFARHDEVPSGSSWPCCCSDLERGSVQRIAGAGRRPPSSEPSLRSSEGSPAGSDAELPLLPDGEDPFLQAPAVPPAAAPTKNLPKPAEQQVEAPAPEPAQVSTRSEGHDRRLAKLRAAVAMHRPSRTSEEAAQIDDSDAKSESAFSARSDFSVQTAVIAQHSQSQQPQDAAGLKAALKTFIQDFVRGRELHMPSKNGLSGVVCKITKAVDALLVGDGARAVAFADVLQVHRGLEAMPLSLGHELDSNWVVLELSTGDCLSFHLGHAKGADDFTLFLRLLVSMRRQQQRAAKSPQVDDDAKSEVSVQSAIVQKTMNNSSVASIADDPKEVKKMYKMFVETMKRGRDFYILRPDGTLLDVDCSLTGSREVFRMRWDFQERSVPVADMKQVRTSKESSSLKLGLELDPRCATMELEGGECITFKFGHSEACDRFVICMRILIDQKRQCYRSAGFGRGGAPVQRLHKSSSSVSKQSGDSKAGPNATQVLIEEFVRVMMSGCEVAVLSKQGKQKVKLSLDADLTALSVKAKDGSRKDLLFSK